ncbi:N-acetyltransferase family protein [Sphingobacterium spiritivorum]|uniref:GNAT family N-acetyltransferase n=1 Tax=Sphingobacterium spiritivorum TaxID=258 RepID=UPI003DA1ECF2
MSDTPILRQAGIGDIDRIWTILQQAIELRKQDGSRQWQDGYPNLDTIRHDIESGYGHILFQEDAIIGYVAVIFDGEPAYDSLEGKWLSDQSYAVVHRLAVAQDIKTKGTATFIMQQVEAVAVANKVYSIKVDTNYDNLAMLRIFEKLGYSYCGEVYFRGSARKAFEKLLPVS